jgi:hypothetical protein
MVALAALIGALAGCAAPTAALRTPLAVTVTAPEGTGEMSFTLHAIGGDVELSAPNIRAGATDATLVASTPAELYLGGGVRAAEIAVRGQGTVEVVATAPRMRLSAVGARVRLEAHDRGVGIRTF